MEQPKEFVVRCRAVIIHDGSLLTVRHVGRDFLALPGGHVEFGEDPKECVAREVVEELGVIPDVGDLLCVNTFIDGGVRQPFEFFFHVRNAHDFLGLEELHRSHAHEIEEYVWVKPGESVHLKPVAFAELFHAQQLGAGGVHFLKG